MVVHRKNVEKEKLENEKKTSTKNELHQKTILKILSMVVHKKDIQKRNLN